MSNILILYASTEGQTARIAAKMTQVLREMNRDEVLQIITRDSHARTDIFKVIPAASCEVIDMEFNREVSCFLIRVKKI